MVYIGPGEGEEGGMFGVFFGLWHIWGLDYMYESTGVVSWE